jgi:hypothetical protein
MQFQTLVWHELMIITQQLSQKWQSDKFLWKILITNYDFEWISRCVRNVLFWSCTIPERDASLLYFNEFVCHHVTKSKIFIKIWFCHIRRTGKWEQSDKTFAFIHMDFTLSFKADSACKMILKIVHERSNNCRWPQWTRNLGVCVRRGWQQICFS